jgi:predicted DNA binding CopG/RHH family protein
MRNEYDFSIMKKAPNPYRNKAWKEISIQIDEDTVNYFKEQAELRGIPYQNLINLYFSDCAHKSKTLDLSWR